MPPHPALSPGTAVRERWGESASRAGKFRGRGKLIRSEVLTNQPLEHLTFGWMGENVQGSSISPLYSGGFKGVCLLRNREVL